MIIYLQDRSYYEKLYDKQTIDECLSIADTYRSIKKTNDKKKDKELKRAYWVLIEIMKLERAGRRNNTITKWMEKDKDSDDRLLNTVIPNVSCIDCSNRNLKEESRDLMNKKDGTRSVLFLLVCDACKKRQSYWEDGALWKYDPRCIECNGAVTVIDDDSNQSLLKSTHKCLQCGHEENIEIDLSEKKEEKEEEKEFERLRAECCVSASDGEEFLRDMESWKELSKDIEERKNQKDIYDAVEKIQRLKVSELEKLVKDIIKKNNYGHLNFLSPEIGRNVVIPFTVQDNKKDREEFDSRMELTKIIQKDLKKTNWRLMSDGITYRMGILQGRLRGYEGEDDVVELLKRERK
ncbi:MAG: hypothetical protein ACKUBY_00100 [Candidatus Moraniibacteriota bacterium]|jgi:hypothetical protein